jgi:hypothetical protein
VDVNAIYITPIVPPVYIHQGPDGNEINSARLKMTPIVKKITKKVVPIMKLSHEVAKL